MAPPLPREERRSVVRLTLDEDRDEATIYLSDERQSDERGATFLVVAHDKSNPTPEVITVQLGFEEYERLLWIKVSQASKALPDALLAQADRH